MFSALVFVYDYHPLAVTLEYKRSTYENIYGASGIPENIIWSYIVQIVSALNVIHSVNLAARVIDRHNIIVTEDNRIRINSCGIIDTMIRDSQLNVKHAQVYKAFESNLYQISDTKVSKDEDLYYLGSLIVFLATGSTVTPSNAPKLLDIISNSYSQDLISLLLYLLGKSYHQKSLDQIMSMISPRIMGELSSAYS